VVGGSFSTFLRGDRLPKQTTRSKSAKKIAKKKKQEEKRLRKALEKVNPAEGDGTTPPPTGGETPSQAEQGTGALRIGVDADACQMSSRTSCSANYSRSGRILKCTSKSALIRALLTRGRRDVNKFSDSKLSREFDRSRSVGHSRSSQAASRLSVARWACGGESLRLPDCIASQHLQVNSNRRPRRPARH